MLCYPCSAAVSAPVAFDATRRRAYLCSLDGRLTALAVQGQAAGDLAVAEAWHRTLPAPLFAAPAVVEPSGCVVVAAADGTVAAFGADGEALWSIRLGASVFARPLQFGEGHVLIGASDGELVGIATGTGVHTSLCHLGSQVTSIWGAPLGHGWLGACTGSGTVAVFDAGAISASLESGAASSCRPIDTVRLPGDVFCIGVAVHDGGAVAVGCRDDHVYCLHVN